MARGTTGGPWPASWKPANLGSPAQTRSPIVPFPGGSRAFFSTLDGWVHAIDAKTGAILWETQIGTAAQTGAGGAPAGIFTAFGGAWDYVLVGTRQSANNRFYALDPATGAVIDSFPDGPGDPVGELGAVTGMAAVDYARGQVYFGTFRGATNALWCLKLGPPSDALQRGWEVPRAVLGRHRREPRHARRTACTSAPPRGSCGRSGPPTASTSTATRRPARRSPSRASRSPTGGSSALYFSTTTRIHSAVDNGAGNFLQKWPPLTGLTSPSPVLYWAAQDRLYVGMQAYPASPAGAWLYDVSAATGAHNPDPARERDAHRDRGPVARHSELPPSCCTWGASRASSTPCRCHQEALCPSSPFSCSPPRSPGPRPRSLRLSRASYPACAGVRVLAPNLATQPRDLTYSSRQILDLQFQARLRQDLQGDHLMQFKVLTPGGFLYQVLTVPFVGTAPAPDASTRAATRPLGSRHPGSRPAAAARGAGLPEAAARAEAGPHHGRHPDARLLLRERGPAGGRDVDHA